MSLLRVALLPLLLLGSLALQPARAAGLDDIVKAGVLRVCTPGDYKPFAFQKPDSTFEGIDVDLMQSLAASLSVKVEWVKTSWSNLMADFTGGKCDVAVGGISVTLDRQKRVAFSTAYMVNGKTPLVRCADVAKYQTVADIDKPGVKVIANPGGSNERFAKANFKNATVTIHTDNITIFDEVLKGNADVFVTEPAETIIQQRQKRGLCGVNPDKPLQYGEMAYMLPRGDVVTKDYIDQWLHLTKSTGEYQRIVARWL